MAEDRIREVWQKALNATIPDIAYDSQGNIYVVTVAGEVIKLSGTGTVLQRKQLENPLFSVAVDPNSSMITVGDAQNNVYGFNTDLELQWAKNLGEGNIPAVNIVSTINGKTPDADGDINLANTYYSQAELDDKMATFGKVKTVNGNMPNDAGNVTLDLGNYYVFSGYINTEDDLDKATASGWYVTKAPLSFETLGTVVTYHAEPNSSQLFLGLDNTMWYRSFSANTWGSWVKVTNDVKTINGKAPDANGNIDVEAKGAVTSINGVTPDESGEVQIAAGSEGAVKSINNTYKPDKNTGNVNLPVYAPNLMDDTSNIPIELWLKGTSNANLLQDKDTEQKTDTPVTFISSLVTQDIPTTYNLILRLQNTNSVHITVEGYDDNPTDSGASLVKTYDLGTYDKAEDTFSEDNGEYHNISKSFTVTSEYLNIRYFKVIIDNTVPTNGENLVLNSHQVYKGNTNYSPTTWFKLGDMKLAQKLSESKKYRIWYKVKYTGSYINDAGGFVEAYNNTSNTFNPNGPGNTLVEPFNKIAPTRYEEAPKETTKTYFTTDASELDDSQVLLKASPDSSDRVYPNSTTVWETTGPLVNAGIMDHIEIWEHHLSLSPGDTIEVWLKIAEEDSSTRHMGWSPAKGEDGYYAPMLFEQMQLYDKEKHKETYQIDYVSHFPEDADIAIANTNKYRISALIDATQITEGSIELALQSDKIIVPIKSQAVIGGTKGTAYIDIALNGQEDDLPLFMQGTGVSQASQNIDTGYSSIYYSSLKISHWPSPNDPPDTTWLPSVNDINTQIAHAEGSVKSINGKRPASDGSITLPEYQPNLITADTKDFTTLTENTRIWHEYIPVSVLKSGDDLYASVYIENNSTPVDGDVTLQFLSRWDSGSDPVPNQTLSPLTKNIKRGYVSAVWHSPLASNDYTASLEGRIECLTVYLMLSGTTDKTTYKDLVVRTKSPNTNTLNTEWSPSTAQLNSEKQAENDSNISDLYASANNIRTKVNKLNVDGNLLDVNGNMVSAPYSDNLLYPSSNPDAWEDYASSNFITYLSSGSNSTESFGHYEMRFDTYYKQQPTEQSSYLFTIDYDNTVGDCDFYLKVSTNNSIIILQQKDHPIIKAGSKGKLSTVAYVSPGVHDSSSWRPCYISFYIIPTKNDYYVSNPIIPNIPSVGKSHIAKLKVRHYQAQAFYATDATPDKRYKPNTAYIEANNALSAAKQYTDNRVNTRIKGVICSQSTYTAMSSHDPNTVYFLTS